MLKDLAANLEHLYTSVTQVRQTMELLHRFMPVIDDLLVFLTTQRFDSETIKS